MNYLKDWFNFVDFIGAGCQYELDACQENVCQNNAVCELLENGNYRCICEPGFNPFWIILINWLNILSIYLSILSYTFKVDFKELDNNSLLYAYDIWYDIDNNMIFNLKIARLKNFV